MDRRLGDVHFDDIVAARRLLARSLTPTPLVTHPLLSSRIGAEAHVKLENAVPLGSFKLRGGLNYVASLSPEQRARGLVTATRGDAGRYRGLRRGDPAHPGSEPLGAIREAELRKIPYMLVVGDREVEERTASVRKHKEGDQGALPVELLAEKLSAPE